MAGLLHCLPLANVTAALIVDGASLWDVIRWDKLLSFLPSVEELTLYYELVTQDDGRLSEIKPCDALTLCPRLQMLHIRECQLKESYFVFKKPAADCVSLAQLARGIVARGEKTLTVHAEAVDGAGVVKGLPSLGQGPQTTRRWLAAGMSQISAMLVRR
ncbi:uncharacterized protein PHACADRAFT_246136 [Phanerochaete carnosa HHB-10118-sp]|uniref:F-box domain-containing protein n=1 Tax=Phanerochaete carnosa (strain HHB-10118-sp) TaxID=650164 RepID=K5WLG0_PHACS|nr:uncharacterized protein PHACADRAFT_246136 [Phanerochaete carnosa HHB-10118-sp]EKM60265.1 hypothetical protein PHACADRAFT_246136 [Phanerochaete carnosa HHB-10118-sp]